MTPEVPQRRVWIEQLLDYELKLLVHFLEQRGEFPLSDFNQELFDSWERMGLILKQLKRVL